MFVSKLKTVFISFICFSCLTLLFGCVEKDIYRETPETPAADDEAFFDFSMKKDIHVDIDYGFDNLTGNGDYQVVFELYKEIPYTYDAVGNRSKKADVYPVYSAWTDGKGCFSQDVTLPSALKEVYLASNFIGTVDLVKLTIENGQLTFNQKEYLANLTKAATTKAGNTWTLPGTDWLTLGNWEANGKPEYLMADKNFSASFLEDMNTMFRSKSDDGGIDIWDRHPEFFIAKNGTKTDMDIHITKATRVSMSVIRTMAELKSAIGYYVYKTDTRPSAASDITAYYIAFPHVSKYSPAATGNQVRLMFPGENGLTETFPAGYSIGFFMAVNGFDNGNITTTGQAIVLGSYADREVIFSTSSLNDPNKNSSTKGQRSVALFEPDSKQMIALGFEDYPSWDKDYNDALLNIFVEQPDAIDTGDMPELEDTDPKDVPQAKSVYEGMILFEDLWPSKGDYDMNDAVVSYHCTLYRDKNNHIASTEDIFTPLWSGASFNNGFGFQYGSVQVKDVTIDYGVHPEPAFMKGQSSEPGQSKPTLILIDNMTNETKENVKNQPIRITTHFSGNVTNLVPPYNPFIIVHSDQVAGIRTEVHLINHLPTDLVNSSELGTKDDKSNPDKGVYYVAALKYPFALDVPTLAFRIINEKVDIYNAYPQFSTWVESNGKQAENWYDYPKENLVH